MTYQIPPVVGSWIEWPMNSARAILSLLINRVTLTMPNIRFIFAHDGGAMPMFVGRIAGLGQSRRADFVAKFKEFFPNGIEAEYRKLYFDMAQGYYPVNYEAMHKLVPDTHMMFGTDYPYFSQTNAVDGLKKLHLPAGLLAKIERGNAEALLPRWKEA
jgi:predicted TIM-barrel fold metal-dependent hydrolase